MKSMNYKLPWSPLVLALAGILVAGCHTVPQPKPLTLQIKKVANGSVDVDVVGIQPGDKDQLASMKPDQWWMQPPNDIMRKGYADMMVTTNFKEGDTWVIDSSDRIWSKWMGAGVTELMVIADLDRVHYNDKSDTRRKFLTLAPSAWPKDRRVEVQVQDGRVWVVTPEIAK